MNNTPVTPRNTKFKIDHLDFKETALPLSGVKGTHLHALSFLYGIPENSFLEIEKLGEEIQFTFKMSDPQVAKELIAFLLKKQWVVPTSRLNDFLDVKKISVVKNQHMDSLKGEDQKPVTEINRASILKTAKPFLETVNSIVEVNLGNEDFRPKQLAQKVFLCEMQLYRKLKKLTGLSTSNYIRKYRLQRSLDYLKEERWSISEVGFRVGFRSLEYFSRSFKKEFGLCPTRYRKDVEIVQ